MDVSVALKPYLIGMTLAGFYTPFFGQASSRWINIFKCIYCFVLFLADFGNFAYQIASMAFNDWSQQDHVFYNLCVLVAPSNFIVMHILGFLSFWKFDTLLKDICCLWEMNDKCRAMKTLKVACWTGLISVIFVALLTTGVAYNSFKNDLCTPNLFAL